jgi:hypothetical protein
MNKQQTQERTPQHSRAESSRREWLRQMTALCAWLMAAGVRVDTRADAAACPVRLYDDGWTPAELTYEDVQEVVALLLGYDHEYRKARPAHDEELLAVIWRFRTLPPEEAADWFKRLAAKLGEWHAYMVDYFKEQEGRQAAYRRAREERDRARPVGAVADFDAFHHLDGIELAD